MPDTDHTMTTENALHAAAAWLQRLGAGAAAVAVVRFFPSAAVGLWTPGREHVGMLPTIDDPGAELCDAAAPWLQAALERMAAKDRAVCDVAVSRGAQLEALLIPSLREISLRLKHDGRAVVLCATQLDGDRRQLH